MIVCVEYARVLATMWLIHYLFCFAASQLKATCTTTTLQPQAKYRIPPSTATLQLLTLIFSTASSQSPNTDTSISLEKSARATNKPNQILDDQITTLNPRCLHDICLWLSIRAIAPTLASFSLYNPLYQPFLSSH
jgi:hypothetical protein